MHRSGAFTQAVERAWRHCNRRQSGRTAQPLLRATVGDIDAVFIHQDGHSTQGGDAIGNDERVHFPLSVGPLPATFGGAAIVVVTHVDVIPPQRENGTGLVKQLAEDSRKDDGNLRFEAVTQTNRQNHFSVVEAWKNHSALDTHSMNAKTRGFRDKLAPASGALYDERLYKVVN